MADGGLTLVVSGGTVSGCERLDEIAMLFMSSRTGDWPCKQTSCKKGWFIWITDRLLGRKDRKDPDEALDEKWVTQAVPELFHRMRKSLDRLYETGQVALQMGWS